MTTAVLVWGTQLSRTHHTALHQHPDAPVLVIEAWSICRARPWHKQKLAFVLAAMRDFVDDLRAAGRVVHHVPLEEAGESFWDDLGRLVDELGLDRMAVMQTADRAPGEQLARWCSARVLALEVMPNGLFLTPRDDFATWASGRKRLLMDDFYRWQRRRLGLLLDGDEPVGGRWSLDADNRKPLPKRYVVPPRTAVEPTRHDREVRALVVSAFADNPGDLDVHWLPSSRRQALQQLAEFVEFHLPVFGDYEDAMRADEPFVHHSTLSAALNAGILHPSEVLDAALAADVPLNSLEGFVRQVVGWREFVHGLYWLKPDSWRSSNALGATRPLEDWWWRLEGAPELPLAAVLARLKQLGYTHHIERLMVLGSWMLLHDTDPQDVLDWFMAMYVDAYDWVMVPNVIGMSQYADGGLDAGGFATKPYVSGSPYLQRMGGFWPTAAAAKESGWTPAYWGFLARHEGVLGGNHRLGPVYRQLHRQGSAPGATDG